MAPLPDDHLGMLTMDSILSASFWDSVLVPGMLSPQALRGVTLTFGTGYSNTMEGISGGFVYGAGGSGMITPGMALSPLPSGFSTPSQQKPLSDLTQHKIDAAFDASPVHSVGI